MKRETKSASQMIKDVTVMLQELPREKAVLINGAFTLEETMTDTEIVGMYDLVNKWHTEYTIISGQKFVPPPAKTINEIINVSLFRTGLEEATGLDLSHIASEMGIQLNPQNIPRLTTKHCKKCRTLTTKDEDTCPHCGMWLEED